MTLWQFIDVRPVYAAFILVGGAMLLMTIVQIIATAWVDSIAIVKGDQRKKLFAPSKRVD